MSGDFASETDLDAELKLIRLNVVSAVHLAKRVLPGMVERDQGRLQHRFSPGPGQHVRAGGVWAGSARAAR